MSTPTTPPSAPSPDKAHLQKFEEDVKGIFSGTATTLWLDALSPSIPERLHHGPNTQPSIPGWNPPTRVLCVQCGKASQHLGAIVFRTKRGLDNFTQRNPALQKSLVTWWPASSYVLWMRALDYRVPDVLFDRCTWVGYGAVPVAFLQAPARHFVDQAGPIASVEMYSVAWPKQMQQHLHMLIFEETFGPRYHQSATGKCILNPIVWAQFLAKEMELAYHVEGETFTSRKENGDGFEVITIEKLMTKTAHHMHLAAQREPIDFPIAEIKAQRIRNLIEEMKVAVGFHIPEEQNGCDAFLADCVEKRSAGDLTVAELYQEFTNHCRAKALPRLPQSIFERKLPGLVRVMFGITKSHDLRRPAGDGALRWHRGFRGLALKAKTDGAKGTDASDGSDGLPKNPEVALGVAAHQNQPKDMIPTHSEAENTPTPQTLA